MVKLLRKKKVSVETGMDRPYADTENSDSRFLRVPPNPSWRLRQGSPGLGASRRGGRGRNRGRIWGFVEIMPAFMTSAE